MDLGPSGRVLIFQSWICLSKLGSQVSQFFNEVKGNFLSFYLPKENKSTFKFLILCEDYFPDGCSSMALKRPRQVPTFLPDICLQSLINIICIILCKGIIKKRVWSATYQLGLFLSRSPNKKIFSDT